MTWFARATLNIPHLYSTVAMHSLLVGFHVGKSLCIPTLYSDPSVDMDQPRARTTGYISIKENVDVRRKQ